MNIYVPVYHSLVRRVAFSDEIATALQADDNKAVTPMVSDHLIRPSVRLNRRIYGTVITSQESPKWRLIVIDRKTLKVVRIEFGSSNGYQYEIRGLGDSEYLVICVDDNGEYNAEVFDHVKPELF